MITNFIDVPYNETSNSFDVVINNSLALGYPNRIPLIQTANIIAIPEPGWIVNIEEDRSTQVVATGFQTRVIDENLTLPSFGETVISAYDKWHMKLYKNGFAIQEANTTHIENMMMGQSSNKVQSDVLGYLILMFSWLLTHTHDGVSTGSGTSGAPSSPPPSDTTISNDKTYIDGNKNLAITGTYTPA